MRSLVIFMMWHMNSVKWWGEPFYTADNLIDATNNTDIFADISSGIKVTALVLIKMANDFRLMASGPRCGIGELKLPPRQPVHPSCRVRLILLSQKY